MFKHLKNPLSWLHGLVAAFIGGGAGATGLAVWKPETFNVHDGLSNLCGSFVAIGLTNAFSYLKKSPLPDLIETVTVTSTQTVTKETTTPTPETPKI